MMKRKGLYIILLVLGVPLGLVVLFYWYLGTVIMPSGRPYQHMAMQEVGTACLMYIRDCHQPPEALNRLIKTGYLIRQKNEMVKYPGGMGAGGYFASKIYLSFPDRADVLEIKNGKLVEKATGKERFLIHILLGTAPLIADPSEVNVWIWQNWKLLEEGKPVGEAWFKIKVTATRPITIQ